MNLLETTVADWPGRELGRELLPLTALAIV
jgi:hypothetical protein